MVKIRQRRTRARVKMRVGNITTEMAPISTIENGYVTTGRKEERKVLVLLQTDPTEILMKFRGLSSSRDRLAIPEVDPVGGLAPASLSRQIAAHLAWPAARPTPSKYLLPRLPMIRAFR